LTILGAALDVATQNSLFLGLTFIVALPAMPLWTALARRLGAWRALRICLISSAVTLFFFFLPTGFFSGLTVAVIFGLNLAGLLMLTDLLIADVVDADELATGARREGLYFGMNGLVIRFAFTIQGIITAVTLTWTGYITPTAAVLYPVQPAATLWGIRIMIAGIPALALLLGYVLLSRYSLHGARLTAVQIQVAALHAQKQSQLHKKSS
jgi:GPH family glycoside/pentoside/hexuronide:cation symporter